MYDFFFSFHKDKPTKTMEQNEFDKLPRRQQICRSRYKSKSIRHTFALWRKDCPTLTLDNRPFPFAQNVLGLHLDRRLIRATLRSKRPLGANQNYIHETRRLRY